MTDEEFPPLIVSPKYEPMLGVAQVARMNEQLQRFRERGGALVVSFPCDVRQLVDGRWELVPTEMESE